MKVIRQYRTVGNTFYCECNFLPDFSNEDECDDLNVPDIPGTDVQLRMSFLLRYPKKVTQSSVFNRLSCISHPNLSPVIVTEEVMKFLLIIKSMLS